MRTPLRLMLSALALLFVATACSAGSSSGSSSGAQGKNNGSPGASVAPTQKQIAKEFSEVNVPAPAANQREPECATTQQKPLSSPPPEDGSFIHITIAAGYSMGPECNKMAPGSNCQVPLRGGWRIAGCTGVSCGSVVIQVFENDKKEPTRSPEVGPVPGGGQFNPDTSKLTYKVSADATTATFRAILKDLTGRVIARSEPQTVPLPVCIVEEGSS